MACCLPFLFSKKDTQNALEQTTHAIELATVVVDVINKELDDSVGSGTKILDEVVNQVIDKSVEVITEKAEEVVTTSVDLLNETNEVVTETAQQVDIVTKAVTEAITEAVAVNNNFVENTADSVTEASAKIEQKNYEDRLKVKEAVRAIVREAIGTTQ